jgi:hypothetical protein
MPFLQEDDAWIQTYIVPAVSAVTHTSNPTRQGT